MKPDAMRAFSMDGRVVVITGGAGFLGMQYAEILSLAGATVVLWDKKDVLSTEYTAFKVDITNEEDVKILVKRILEMYGRIDVLVNNAGMNPAVGSDEAKHLFSPYEQYPMDLWRKEFEVNIDAAMICIKTVVPHMMENQRGVIVNIASGVSMGAYDNRNYKKLGQENRFKSIAYTTSKTAMIGLTRQWAEYLGPYNVRVNSFSPGGVQTTQHTEKFVKIYSEGVMLGRMAQIGEYGPVMLFLCSDASSYMTGNNLIVDGGKSAW